LKSDFCFIACPKILVIASSVRTSEAFSSSRSMFLSFASASTNEVFPEPGLPYNSKAFPCFHVSRKETTSFFAISCPSTSERFFGRYLSTNLIGIRYKIFIFHLSFLQLFSFLLPLFRTNYKPNHQYQRLFFLFPLLYANAHLYLPEFH